RAGSSVTRSVTGWVPTRSVGTIGEKCEAFRQLQTPPSGGRTESLRKGLSGMDAARATMGQGWPFDAGPWSNDGVREVERSETRMSGASVFGYFFRDWKK